MNVREYYHQALNERGYRPDAAQEAAIERLQRYYDDWINFKKARSSALKKIFRRPPVPRGVYMWGGVGRGKSFLMDAFYLTVPVRRKTRVHFHEFMRACIANWTPCVASRIHCEWAPHCQALPADLLRRVPVSDVADAMILYRLLLCLFKHGTSFVMTSNYEPSTLYPDGLHRDRVCGDQAHPAAYGCAQCRRWHRLPVARVEQVRMYLTPITGDTNAELRAIFDRLLDTAPMEPDLIVENRKLRAVALGGSIVWFDFATLCGGPRSQNDYLDLASRFQTVILSDVPRMAPRDASQARRFTWLIDVFYDHKVKLVMSAECPAEALYTKGPMSNEFHRTVSRILEMQSREYLEEARREAVTL